MNTFITPRIPALLLLTALLLSACGETPTGTEVPTATATVDAQKTAPETIEVSGSAIHYLSTATVHSQEPTSNGMIQRSTDIIELSGDLSGYILYHPTSVVDFAAGTLVNTGTQMFSGTVAGSAPLLLHDDAFRFEVDLNTGATTGTVHLRRSQDAPDKGGWYECDIKVVGTGVTPEGDNLSDYSGTCTARGNLNS